MGDPDKHAQTRHRDKPGEYTNSITTGIEVKGNGNAYVLVPKSLDLCKGSHTYAPTYALISTLDKANTSYGPICPVMRCEA